MQELVQTVIRIFRQDASGVRAVDRVDLIDLRNVSVGVVFVRIPVDNLVIIAGISVIELRKAGGGPVAAQILIRIIPGIELCGIVFCIKNLVIRDGSHRHSFVIT